MTLITQLLISTLMIGITVAMHAIGLDFIIRKAKTAETLIQRLTGSLWHPVLSAVTVISVFILHVAQIWLWAFLYLFLKCQPLEGIFAALKFSTAIYTTVGDSIVLEDSCRMLSGIEGANGFLLFGWTTAFIFEVISQFYRREARSLAD